MRSTFATLTLVACLLLSAVAPASAAQADDLTLLTTTTATMLPGQTAWVILNWQAEADVTDVQISVKGNKVTAAYPSDRPATSFHDSADLAAGNVDFTAIRITVPANTTNDIDLKLNLSYTGPDGTTKSKEKPITVPITVPTGADFDQVTTAVGPVAAGSAFWVELTFRGARTVTDFSVTLPNAAGAALTYPSGRDATSLYHDVTLDPAETDFVAFRLDTAGVEPGTYTLPLRFTWAGGGTSSSSVTLTLS